MYRFKIKHIKFLIFIILVLFTSNANSQSCTITSKANDIIPDNLCAPVAVDWEITYRGVNDGGGTNGISPWTIEIQVDWDDGNVITTTATLTNASLHEWKITISNVYPVGGNKCNYRPTAQLVVDGVICTSSIQEQNVTVWDTDDYNGGHLEISPQIFPICVGHDGTVTFQDVSLWNCVPPVENDNPNNPMRWTQWLYGTNYDYNNVEVNGSVQSYPFAGAIVPTSEPILGPEPPNNTSLPCYGPNTGNVGEYWEITLRNWNYCNPYDDPSISGPPSDVINGDFPPIITTAMILVVDTPDATINPVGPFCANHSPIHLHAATNGGTWSGPGIVNSSNGKFNPSVAGPGIHTIHYTVYDANGCPGTGVTTITVYALPSPDIIPGSNAEVCPGDVLALDGNTTLGDGAIVSSIWTGDITPLSSTNTETTNFSTTAQGTYNLTYTVIDDNGCSNFDLISIGVNPVVPHIIPDPAEICAGEDLTLNGNPSGGTGNYTSHIWTGDITNLNVTNTQEVIFNSPTLGTYNLTYTVTDDHGCTGTDNIIVTVSPMPIANAGIDDSVCADIYNLNAISSFGSGLWSQLSGIGTATFSSATDANTNVSVDTYGIYEFVWTETNGPGCVDKDTVKIIFTEQPIADAGIDGGICGLDYQLQAIASVGTGTWSFVSGPGNIIFDNIHNPNTIVHSDIYGVYILMWKEDNGYGCVDSNNVQVSFNLVPVPAFDPINPDGCSEFTVQFTNNSTGGTIYNWDFGDGTTDTAENPIHTFINTTTNDIVYTVQLAVNNPGCGDTIQQTVTVHPSPKAEFTTDAQPGCSPLSANFFNASTGSVLHIYNFNDGTNLDTNDITSHTFVNDTSFIQNFPVQIIAISQFGCRDTAEHFVTVYPNQSNNFTLSPDSACHPATVTFTANPTGQSYFWDFGNGTSEIGTSDASSVYSNTSNVDSTYSVMLITTSYFGCIDTSYNNVVIMPSPQADFVLDANSGCSPHQSLITNQSTGAVSYYWNFGDGTTGTDTNLSFTHQFVNVSGNATTYSINLTAVNSYGCSSTKEKTITIYPEIYAHYNSDTIGCSPLDIDFANVSSGAVSYIWDFSDGSLSTETNPSHTFENTTGSDQIFLVSLIATSQYSCTDTFSREILVYPSPMAMFIATPTSAELPNAMILLNNQTQGTWDYHWDFGDGDTSNIEEPGSHTYTTYGDFSIYLTAYNEHCSDTTSKIVTIIAPEPIAGFSASGNGCVPLDVTFTNNSLYGDNYLWDFGDGNYSNQKDPEYTYYETGHFQVKLTVTGTGGQDTYSDYFIDVYPKAKAYFKVTPSVVYIPEQAIHCYDLSEGAETWVWNFGDGKMSMEQSPLHYYQEEGEYDISLTVNTSHNCPDTYTIPRAVIAESIGEVSFPNAFTPSASGPSDGKYNPNDFDNDIFHPVFSGVDEYRLSIFNRWGELIFESNDPNIGWDGYYRQVLCKQDVYVWKVEGKFINGQEFVKTGDVTLLR